MNNEPDFQTRKHHELVFVFMRYYFCFDDINVECSFKDVTIQTKIS